jgi:hypothetical protein
MSVYAGTHRIIHRTRISLFETWHMRYLSALGAHSRSHQGLVLGRILRCNLLFISYFLDLHISQYLRRQNISITSCRSCKWSITLITLGNHFIHRKYILRKEELPELPNALNSKLYIPIYAPSSAQLLALLCWLSTLVVTSAISK